MWARFAFERESLDRFGGVAPVLQLCFRVRTLGHELILPDQPIPHHNVSLRISSDVLLVRDHDDRDAGLVDQRARNRDALLLTAGKLTRKMVLTTREPDRCKHAIRFFAELRM